MGLWGRRGRWIGDDPHLDPDSLYDRSDAGAVTHVLNSQGRAEARAENLATQKPYSLQFDEGSVHAPLPFSQVLTLATGESSLKQSFVGDAVPGCHEQYKKVTGASPPGVPRISILPGAARR